MSPYWQELGCFVGQQCPFDEASDLLQKLLGVALSDKQIERLCHHHGQLLETELYAHQVEAPHQTLYYVEMDGSTVLTREESTEPGGGKEIKLARLFKAEDVMTIKARTLIRQREYVAYLGDHKPFTERVATRIGGKRRVIGLGDGARWIWDFFSLHYPSAVQILDLYDVLEKLGCWARLLWGHSPRCQDWMNCQHERLESDGVLEVLAAVRGERCLGDSKRQQTALLTYLENNQSRMQYGRYKKAGYLIGSGAIEAANREVIQQRLKRSGQRWTRQGLQQVANLRVAYKSGREQILKTHFTKAA
jgi:hypothetical protein